MTNVLNYVASFRRAWDRKAIGMVHDAHIFGVNFHAGQLYPLDSPVHDMSDATVVSELSLACEEPLA